MTTLVDNDNKSIISDSNEMNIDFNAQINIDEARKLECYDKFTNIMTSWDYDFFDGFRYDFPKAITHLSFNPCFNASIKGRIPNTVTHLMLGHNFNQDIKDCIPNSVTHLNLSFQFNQIIKDCFPN